MIAKHDPVEAELSLFDTLLSVMVWSKNFAFDLKVDAVNIITLCILFSPEPESCAPDFWWNSRPL